MNFELKKASETKTSAWSGGTTSEIYIYPKESTFLERNFLFRISIATVEVEESTFTSLPEINRTLMVLDGKLHLQHEGQHEIYLEAFQQDTFKGDWTTKSKGKVTDFNLMTKGNCSGKLTSIFINEKSKNIPLSENLHLFYVVNGTISVEDFELEKGDLLKISEAQNSLTIFGDGAQLIHVEIRFN